MALCRIIAVGNRAIANDSTGLRVFDELSKCTLPKDLELIEGGLAGLDLLAFIPGAQRVVFVDAMEGLGEGEPFVVMDRATVAGGAPEHYGHSAGLPYLMRLLPEMLGDELPEITVLGVSALADDGAIRLAAQKCLSLAQGGSG